MSDTATDPSSGYEEVRRELARRGYLGGRLERFVLGTLGGGRPAWGSVLRSALRAGLIGAPLLGAWLAAAAAAYNRPLLGAADLPLLWLYFSALAAVALVVLALGAALLLGARARRRGVRTGDATRAAVLVGLPLLAYLALIWWSRGAGAGVAADLLFLGGAVAVTCLVAWLAGLVSLAGIIGRTGRVPDRHRGAALILALLLIPAAALLFAARALVPASGVAESAPEFRTRDDAARLLFIGVDGLDANLLQAFEPRGAVSGLMGAMRSGSTFPLTRAEGREPAEIWTTMLTGLDADRHGVLSAGAERLPGVATPLRRRAAPLPLEAVLRFLLPTRTVPASGAVRLVPTTWEIVGLRRACAAVGWWASWPALPYDAERSEGYVVSDRVLPKLLSAAARDRDTWPDSLFDRLAADFPAERDEIREQFAAGFRLPEGSDMERLVWESYLIDSYSWRVTQRLSADDRVSAAFVYLPGLDILRGRLRGTGEETDLSTLLEIQQALELYVGWLDGLLGGALTVGTERQVMLVADPGRSAPAGAEGFVVVVGPDAGAACVGPSLEGRDVAPLALALLGFPLSAEMEGSPPQGCLSERTIRTGQVATFGRRSPPRVSPVSDYDPEMVERLKSLGYLN